jgi:predicted secreted Zn-dependent protease
VRPAIAVAVLVAGLSVLAYAGLVQARATEVVYSEPSVVRYSTTREATIDLVVNVWQQNYAVPGATKQEVGESLERLRGEGTEHGPYSASTQWDLQVELRYANEAWSCRILGATVEIVALVTLPALQDGSGMSPGGLAHWERYIDRLAAHEVRHVDNEIAGARDLQQALTVMPAQPSCGEVRAAVDEKLAQTKHAILEADARLDAETKHGALTGATFP